MNETNHPHTDNFTRKAYGMAKAVADVDGQNTCGFATDGSNVTGFSHMRMFVYPHRVCRLYGILTYLKMTLGLVGTLHWATSLYSYIHIVLVITLTTVISLNPTALLLISTIQSKRALGISALP